MPVSLRVRDVLPMTKSGGGGYMWPVETENGGQFRDVDGTVGWVHEVNLQSQAQYNQRRRDEAQRGVYQAGHGGQRPQAATRQPQAQSRLGYWCGRMSWIWEWRR
jgi:hypothetical protein